MEAPIKQKASGILQALLTMHFFLMAFSTQSLFSLNVDAQVNALQMPMLCQLVCTDDKLHKQVEAVVGNTLDATIKARLTKMNGPVFVDLKGKNGEF